MAIKKKQRLKEVVFRVNAIYENEKNFNLLGVVKTKKKKHNVRATIWKYVNTGGDSVAYKDFKRLKVEKTDLIFVGASDFTVYNGDTQFVIKKITNKYESKFPKKNKAETKTEDKLVNVPWEEDDEEKKVVDEKKIKVIQQGQIPQEWNINFNGRN